MSPRPPDPWSESEKDARAGRRPGIYVLRVCLVLAARPAPGHRWNCWSCCDALWGPDSGPEWGASGDDTRRSCRPSAHLRRDEWKGHPRARLSIEKGIRGPDDFVKSLLRSAPSKARPNRCSATRPLCSSTTGGAPRQALRALRAPGPGRASSLCPAHLPSATPRPSDGFALLLLDPQPRVPLGMLSRRSCTSRLITLITRLGKPVAHDHWPPAAAV